MIEQEPGSRAKLKFDHRLIGGSERMSGKLAEGIFLIFLRLSVYGAVVARRRFDGATLASGTAPQPVLGIANEGCTFS